MRFDPFVAAGPNADNLIGMSLEEAVDRCQEAVDRNTRLLLDGGDHVTLDMIVAAAFHMGTMWCYMNPGASIVLDLDKIEL